MTKYKNRYRAETTRLKGWDYTTAGWYFVTICTRNRKPYFGEILDDEMHLSSIGKILADEWQETALMRPYISLDEWVIMPNHIHGIIISHNDEVFIKVKNELALVGRMSHTYAEVHQGEPLALIGSRNTLEIAVNRGSACEYYDASNGDEILILKGKRGQ